VVEGTERDGHVRLDVFLQELRRLHGALSKVDASLVDGQRNSHFAVVGLSHSSPATVELEPRVEPNRQDVRPLVVGRLIDAIESVELGVVSNDTDYDLLADLRGLAAPVGSTLKAATLNVGGRSFDLTPDFARRIDAQLAEYESCVGTIEGMLERINVHADANVFTIYPDIGPRLVTCHFGHDLVETAVAAVKRRVAVTGLMRYRKLAAFPYQIDVTEIEIYDPEDSLPGWGDLRGIAPDATGNASSEDFLARFRDGWV
jgi:hypothetical protein